MNPINILIVEDKKADALFLEATLSAMGYRVAGIAGDLRAALDLYVSLLPDITLIDIDLLGRQDGLVLAEGINGSGKKRPFIFLTGISDRSTFEKAKATSPASYLLKPFNELELQFALELALENFARRQDAHNPQHDARNPPKGPLKEEGGEGLFLHDHFFVKKGNRIVKIGMADIGYIEVEGKYSKIVTKKESFLIAHALSEIIQRPEMSGFRRVHRNFLVNMSKIKEININENMVLTEDGHLPISRRYMEAFLEAAKPLK